MLRLRLSRFTALSLIAIAVAALSRPTAAGLSDQRGEVALALMLRKLATVGTVMHVTAHPDDENNSLLAMESQGEGLRVVLATATRGNGGQNEIGPEIFEALGVLRTEELLAAHRVDGAEQFFARAVDFGYSFSIDESFEKWGKDEIVGDYVRLIRLTRPDVMITMRPDGTGGGQHHQASARIGAEAFRAAGDPARYPDQIKEGLRPWQPAKVYQAAYYGMFQGDQPPPTGHLVTVDGNTYDELLGKTYAEIGSEARAMHKCQGFGQLLALPGPWVVKYRLADTVLPGQQDKDEATLFDGVGTSPSSLLRFAGDKAPAYPFEDVYFTELRSSGAGQPVRLTRAFAVAPGTYDVYIALRERPGSGTTADAPVKVVLLKQEVVVPNYHTDELQTSSVLVADKIEPLTAPIAPEAMKERPYVLGDSEITPAADLKFKKSEELQLVFQIYGARLGADTKKPDVSVDYVFYQKEAAGEKMFNRTPTQTLDDKSLPKNFDPEMGHQLMTGQGVPLLSFPEGDYRLEIKITDKPSGKTITQNVNFSVASS